MERTDEYGKWEVIEGNGFINERCIEPTQLYIDEHPEEFQTKPKTEIELLQAKLTLQTNRLSQMEADAMGFQDFILETIMGGM